MSLNEWVSRLMSEGPEDATSQDYFNQPTSTHYLEEPRMAAEPRYETLGHPADEVSRVTQAIEALSDRISTAEARQALAIAGIERSVREVIDRIDVAEREQMQVAARFEGDVQEVKAETSKVADRMRRIEDEAVGPRSAEAMKSLEGALGKVASRVYEGDTHARQLLGELKNRVEQIDAAGQATASATAEAIGELKQSCTALDDRLSLSQSGSEVGVEKAAENLSVRVEAVREDLGRQLTATTEARFDRMEQALAEMSQHVRAAEQRSAGAIERMGREVLDVAQSLSRRVQSVEHGSVETAGRVTAEMSRIAGAVEDRLIRADNIQAQALEKLGAEISRITERLAERIANAERRSAQAIDDVGEQVARVTERIGERSDRATNELADRIRQSEERTARLLDEARQKIDERLADNHRRLADTARPQATAYDDPDEALFGDAPFPGFETPAAERPSPHVEAHAAAFPAAEPVAAAHEPAVSAAGLTPLEPTVFDDEDFAAAADFAPPAAEPAQVAAPQSAAPQAAAPMPAPAPLMAAAAAPAPTLVASSAVLPDLEDVELEPNIGFDVDDELIGPATHAFGSVAPAPPQAADTLTRAPAADVLHEPAAAVAEAARSSFQDEEDEPATYAETKGLFHEPEAVAEEELPAPPVEEPPALTTRDVIERARAAARAANERDGLRPRAATPGRSPDSSVLQGLTFGRSQRKPGGTTSALMVASLLAAVGLSAGGYMVFEGKPGGKLPKRVSDALAVVQGQAPDAGTDASAGSGPLAALALAPKPVADGPAAPDYSAAYSAAVAKVGANEAGGVGEIRKLADTGYAPAQFYLAELFQDGKAGLKKDPTQARGWLERAAEGGDRTAMHNLALDLHEGVGGGRNAAQAAEWFRRAAELGLLDSQFNLAAIYEHGDGVSQNPAEAYKWYLIAGRSGDAEAKAGALRVRTGLTPDARAMSERAAADFQPSTPNPSTLPASTLAANGTAASSPDMVTAQRALNQLGYYQGPTDGVPSPALKLALSAYQRDQSLPVSGAPDAATIGKLAVYTK